MMTTSLKPPGHLTFEHQMREARLVQAPDATSQGRSSQNRARGRAGSKKQEPEWELRDPAEHVHKHAASSERMRRTSMR